MRTNKITNLAALALTGGLLWAGSAEAAVIIAASGGDKSWSSWVDDQVGDSSTDITDATPDPDVVFQLTTQSLVTIGSGTAKLDRTGGGFLGITNNAEDNSSRFEAGESWTFDTDDTAIRILRIQFTGGSGAGFNGGDTATLQSEAWIGASVTPDSSNVTFDSITGTFTLVNGESGENYDLQDLWGAAATESDALGIATGVDVVLSHPGTSTGDGWRLSELELATFVIPEPTSLALLGLGSLFVAGRRRDA